MTVVEFVGGPWDGDSLMYEGDPPAHFHLCVKHPEAGKSMSQAAYQMWNYEPCVVKKGAYGRVVEYHAPEPREMSDWMGRRG